MSRERKSGPTITGGGIDGAHWGDLDGDGTDEMILGMNGFGGLHALSAEGKRLWRVRGIANVWNQAVIPAGKQPAMVFATEAGGTIRVFDGEGKRVRTLHPLGDYYAGMTAAVMDAGHSVQLLAIGNGRVVVFDPTGTVAWHTPTNANWVNQFCASGDLDGDGTAEWVFFDDADNLVIASIEGVRKATIENQSGVESFAIAQNSEGKGILVTLQSGTLTAYGFK